MNREIGFIGSDEKSARRLFDAMKEGPVGFSWVNEFTRFDMYMIPVHAFRTAIVPVDPVARWWLGGMVIVGAERMGCFHFNLLEGGEVYSEEYINEKLLRGHEKADAKGLSSLFNHISELALQERRRIIA